MVKIVFLGAQNQPRVIKRILSFYDKSYKIEVYGFDRERFHNINQLPSDINIHKLAKTEDGKKYITKLFLSSKQIYQIYKTYKYDNVIFYSFGILPAFYLWIFNCRNYIYEISDIIYANFKNPVLRGLIRKIDQKIIKNSFLSVLTSQGFVSYLFGKQFPDNVIIIPNKLSTYFSNIKRTRKPISSFVRFAFVGWIRYPNTIFRFAEIIGKKYPNFSFTFYGDSNYREQAVELSQKYENVFFSGHFKNPEDLESIYNNIDVVISCYDISTINERIAEPNKLYEAMFFCKPIVVSPGTFLAKQVEAFNCGYTLDASSDANICNFLDDLNIDNLNQISNQIYMMAKKSLIDNPQSLFDYIESSLK